MAGPKGQMARRIADRQPACRLHPAILHRPRFPGYDGRHTRAG
jgi:hypothetical protein